MNLKLGNGLVEVEFFSYKFREKEMGNYSHQIEEN